MAKTPEKRVKEAVVKILKEFGVYYFFPATGGYGVSGVPDIICCHLGFFVAIECKAGNNKITTLQEIQLNKIKEAGGHSLVIRDTNLEEVRNTLRKNLRNI